MADVTTEHWFRSITALMLVITVVLLVAPAWGVREYVAVFGLIWANNIGNYRG